MTIEEAIEDKGYAISRSNLDNWRNPSVCVANTSSLILCTSGSAEVEINMLKYEITEFSYFGVLQDSLVKLIRATDDFSVVELRILYETGLSATAGLPTETIHNLFLSECRLISNLNERTLILSLFAALEAYTELPKYANHADLAYGMIRSLYISLSDICTRDFPKKSHSMTYSSADYYFMNFVTLLNKYCRHQHDVAFYAGELNITPKYLNEITRKKVNHTAKEVITHFIVAQLKRELLVSNNSVQFIASEFAFCDQSSLGKFFKKATGVSPISYRRCNK